MASLACFSATPSLAAPPTNLKVSTSSSSTSRIAFGSLRKDLRMKMVARASPLGDKVEESIKEAQETCAEKPESAECAVAWDNVEEVSATSAHLKVAAKDNKDPLEAYCKDNPETDECKVYDN